MKYMPQLALAAISSIIAAFVFDNLGSTFGQHIGGGDGRQIVGCLSAALGALAPWLAAGMMILKPTRQTHSVLLKPRDPGAKTWGWAALTAAWWFTAAVMLGWVYRVIADWDVVKKNRLLGDILDDDAAGGVMAAFGLVALGMAVWHYRSAKVALLLVLLGLLLLVGFGIVALSQPWPHA
jgi:hypothetical protein